MSSTWKTTKLKAFTYKIGSGVTPRGGSAVYKKSGIPLIRSQNVLHNRLELNDVAYIDEKQHEKMKGSKVYPNDVLLNITGASIGRCCVVPLDIDQANVNQHVCIIRLNDKFNPNFLSSYLNSWYGQKQITSYQSGGSREGLNFVQIGNLLVPNLKQQEQKAIADILSTWDSAIVKTEKLIAEKEKRFKSLLNELITKKAKKEGWKKRKLGDIGEISSAGVDKKSNVNEKPVRLVNYLDAYKRDFIYSEDLRHQVTAPISKAKSCSVKKGDIFFTPSSEVRTDIGHSAIAMEDIPDAVYSYHIIRLRLNVEWDLIFRAYAFKSQSYFKQAQRFSDGSGQRYVISQSNFRKITIMVPPIAAQKKIANILYSAQEEANILKKFVSKYKEQKRGLMQKLLTGKWRVKIK